MNCPYCLKYFKSWLSVRGHVSHCLLNNKEFCVDLEYGAIHFSELLDPLVHKRYKNTTLQGYLKTFKKNNIISPSFSLTNIHTKESILKTIEEFVHKYNYVPSTRDFDSNILYPNSSTVRYYFSSWNEAIIEAGYNPVIQNGFGASTYGLDDVLYRSKAEAYFSDTYLYNKYNYIVEPKYPKPHYKYYDWYLPKLDLYIELDGGCRPEVILDKIKINLELNRNLLVIPYKLIYKFNNIDELRKACAMIAS